MDLDSAAIYHSYPNYNFKSELERMARELRVLHANLQKINDGKGCERLDIMVKNMVIS